MPMRTLSCALLALAVGSSLSAQSSTMVGTRLADGVWSFRASLPDGYARANTVVVINEHDVLVFDSNIRPSITLQVLAEIRRLTSKPVRYVVNSHWHPDHWSGNQVYADSFPGVTIIATAEAARYMRHVAPSWSGTFAANLARRTRVIEEQRRTRRTADGRALSDQELTDAEAGLATYRDQVQERDSIRYTLPTLVYERELTLTSGRRTMRLMSHAGDAAGSTVLYLPAESVLVMGDVLVHPVTWTTNSYQIAPWIESLRLLRSLPVRHVVPGHGLVQTDHAYLALVLELFETVTRQVHETLARGAVSVDEVQQALRLDDLRRRFVDGDESRGADFDGTAQGLARKIYLEAREGMEVRRT